MAGSYNSYIGDAVTPVLPLRRHTSTSSTYMYMYTQSEAYSQDDIVQKDSK